MDIESKRISGKMLAAVVLFLLSSCAPTPYLFLQYGSELKPADVGKILAENPIGPAENIKTTILGRGQSMSHHVVQIRDRETPHIHKFHDLTVIMIKGQGYMMMDNRRVQLSVSDVAHIPRGAVHYFVNTSHEPAAAFVIFSPPFDGTDYIPVKVP